MASPEASPFAIVVGARLCCWSGTVAGMILRPVLRRNDAVLLQDGSQPLDLALLIVRFLRRERPRPFAFDQFAHSRFVCTRSEEHTSELQSLMRISYAVFC